MSVVSKLRTLLHRTIVVGGNYYYHKLVFGMDLGKGVRISLGAKIDKTFPRGVHIGDHTAITSGAAILTHDFVHREHREVRIGKNCFIGFYVVVLPGVTIGDGCIISANSVVARDIPAHSVAMGNPAKVVERDIVTGPWGIRLDKGRSEPVRM